MLRVVLIDDEFYMRKALALSTPWEEACYELVGEADNGVEGLELIKSLEPDLALVDINMPHMDGLTLIKKLQEENIDTKCIILTGYGEFTYAREALRLGVLNYILKPVNQTELMKSLREVYRDILINKRDKLKSSIKQLANTTDTQERKKAVDTIGQHIQQGEEMVLYTLQLVGNKENKDISSMLGGILDKLQSKSMSFYWEQNRQIFNVLVPNKEREVVELDLIRYKDILKEQGEHLVICRSQAIKSLEDLRAYYQNNALLLSSRLVLTEPVLMLDQLSKDSDYTVKVLDHKRLEELLIGLRKKDGEGIEELLRVIFKQIKDNQFPIGIIQSKVNKLMDIIHNYLEEISALDKPMRKSIEAFYHIDDWAESCEDIGARVERFYLEAMGLEGEEVTEADLLVEDIKVYIQEHFHEQDCNINQVVDHFNFNYHYICKLFKNKTEVSLGEYIIQTRMTQAKYFIESGISHIESLADACGYSDGRYFSKSFKKHYGVTPSSYIKRRRSR